MDDDEITARVTAHLVGGWAVKFKAPRFVTKHVDSFELRRRGEIIKVDATRSGESIGVWRNEDGTHELLYVDDSRANY